MKLVGSRNLQVASTQAKACDYPLELLGREEVAKRIKKAAL